MITEQTIVDMINAKTQVFYIDPATTTIQDVKARDSGKYNTQAVAVTTVGQAAPTRRKIAYNREDIRKVSLVTQVATEGALTLAAAIDDIRDQTGLPLTVEGLTLGDTTNPIVKIVRATPTNPAYIGSIELVGVDNP